MYPYSNLLFSQPSFLEGLGRVVDFGGLTNTYNESPSPQLADSYALRGDWYAIGCDLSSVMEEFRAAHGIN